MSLVCYLTSEHEVLFYTNPQHRFIKGYTPRCKLSTIKYDIYYTWSKMIKLQLKKKRHLYWNKLIQWIWGNPNQLVRAIRASTTLPMCSLKLRSAAAREISISVICRKRINDFTEVSSWAIRCQQNVRTPLVWANKRHIPHPQSSYGLLLTISSRSSFLMVTFASSFSLKIFRYFSPHFLPPP